jgi:broad specificity phosphatase PhoE
MMARVLLVRHGQASFGARDYDALSDAGKKQSRILGAALAERGAAPDLVLRGNMRRHAQTAEALLEGAGITVDAELDDGWDEFDFQHVVEVHKPMYRNRTLMKADLARTLRPVQAFQEVFEAATARWTSGDHDDDYAESFPAFRGRVGSALERLSELAESHQTLVVVSSGGPIAMAAALLVVGAAEDASLLAPMWSALNRVSVNTGVSKVIAGKRGLSLSTYNEHTHLEVEPRLLTYR